MTRFTTGSFRFLLLKIFVLIFYHSEAQFATLVELHHSCDGSGGYVEFELNGDPSAYTYYWTHGPTSLILDSLNCGNYTFVVRDFYGCVEEYDITIHCLESCYLDYQIIYGINPCIAYIVLEVFTSGDVPIQEQALNIEWEDGNPSGLVREVFLGQSGNYCVTITPQGGLDSCCYIYECIQVNANPSCGDRCNRRMIVNETNRESDGRGQFVELVVTGRCNCERTTDLRGFILDDNNGYLIPGNQFVNEYNAGSTIGADPGYLVFNYSENWDSVPNGSLIVIYNQRDSTMTDLPADDPTDANEDGVYVLQASDADYFFAKSGTWNNTQKIMEYTGTLATPSFLANYIPGKQPPHTTTVLQTLS